jgi:hypothetical protein
MGLFWIAFSQDVAAAEYSNLKWAMLEAIDAPGGVVTGTVVGPIADKFVSTTGSRSLVMVEVTTVKNYRQDGCKRLNIRLKQANVPAKDGKLADFGIDYGVNLCRDGSPPAEGMDLVYVDKALPGMGCCREKRLKTHSLTLP